MEIRGQFSISGRKYMLFVERGLLRDKLYLFECENSSRFMRPIPMKITTSTCLETVRHWLGILKRYLTKKRKKKRSQTRRGNPRDSS